jgi:hypothetical protein
MSACRIQETADRAELARLGLLRVEHDLNLTVGCTVTIS